MGRMLKLFTAGITEMYRRRWPKNAALAFDQMFPGIQKINWEGGQPVSRQDMSDLPDYHPTYAHHKDLALRDDFSAIVADGLICPLNNAVMGPKGHLLAESFSPVLRRDPLQKPLYMLRKPHYVTGFGMPFRATWPAYFHVMIEALPRLLALNEPPFSHLEEIQLLCSTPPSRLEKWFVSRLAPKNCTFVVVDRVDRRWRVENLIFTTFKNAGGFLRPEYLSEFRRRVLPDRPPRKTRRVLINRKGHKREIANMEELEAGLKPWGFETVFPETLSVEEEIALFYDAECVVGAHGSGFTNLIFSSNTAVVEIFATRTFIPISYEICLALGHDYRFVMGRGEDEFPEAYEVDVEAVVGRVLEFGIAK